MGKHVHAGSLLLLSGFLFTTFVLTVNYTGDSETISIKFLPSFFNLAFNGSNVIYVTTSVIGYINYLIFGLWMLNKCTGQIKLFLIIFIAITLSGIGIESFGIFEYMNGTYRGRHARFGISLFLLGLMIVTTGSNE